MNPPSAFARFRILMGLRGRLWARALNRSTGKLLAFFLGLVMMLGWSFGLGMVCFRFAAEHPHLEVSLVHTLALLVFIMQVALGLITLAVAEFFDVSRLLHLPVGYKEVFAAMVVGGLMAPMVLTFASPMVGVTTALGGGVATVCWRLLMTVVLLLLGHATALLLNLVFLSMFTRRRLRDLATLVASGVGIGCYFLYRSMLEGGLKELIERDVATGLHFLPTSWVADLFLLHCPPARLGVEAGLLGCFVLILLGLGAHFLRAAFLGHLPSPQASQVATSARGRMEWLSGDLGAMVRAVRKTYLREPQVKALYLQQTVFLLAPLVFLQMDSRVHASSGMRLLLMVAFILPLSHLHFLWSLFGLDGKGVTQLLLTPVPRWRMLLARGIALGGFFLLADLVLIVLIFVGVGLFHGSVAEYVSQIPYAYVCVALVDLLLLSVGTLTTVFFPMRLATQGRRAIQGQRAENMGCGAQLLRMLIFVPTVIIGALLSFIALWPLKQRFSDAEFATVLPVPEHWAFFTIPGAFLIVLGIYALVVWTSGEALMTREAKLVRALVDTGE